MGKYWTDKTDGIDTMLAENFNDAFTGIESDIAQKADKASTDSALEQKADKISVDADISEVNVALERIKYYGSADVVPSDESWFTVNDTGETITGLTDEGKTKTELVIPYKINGVEITTLYSGINNPPLSIFGCGPYNGTTNTTIAKIVLPNSITSIGDGAFNGCKSLNKINIPNSATSIGMYAFQYCTSLTKVDISNVVTSIGSNAFDNCSNLKIYCEPGSYAYQYARHNGIPIIYTGISNEPTFHSMLVESDINFINGNRVGINGVYMVDYEVTAVDTSIPKVHCLTKKADAEEVLTKTNTTEFTPTGDYQPATKKYVDDLIAALRAELT